MSRRYGRNQKRKHKQIISNLQVVNGNLLDEVENVRKTCNTLTKRLEANENQLHKILGAIEKICYNSILIPPKIIRSSHLRQARVETRQAMTPFTLSFDAMYSPGDMKSISIDIYELGVFIREHWEEMSKAVHLRVSDGQQTSYCVSKEFLQFIPEDEKVRFSKKIFNQLFDRMCEDVDKAKAVNKKTVQDKATHR